MKIIIVASIFESISKNDFFFSRIYGRTSALKFGPNTRTFFRRSYAKEFEALPALERSQNQFKILNVLNKNGPKALI